MNVMQLWSHAHFWIVVLLEMCIYLERSTFEFSSVVIFVLTLGRFCKNIPLLIQSE